jgi:hypothetical protein
MTIPDLTVEQARRIEKRARRKGLISGSQKCRCGRTISANAVACAACFEADGIETEIPRLNTWPGSGPVLPFQTDYMLEVDIFPDEEID